jgi:hypothetical protein
MTARDDFDFSRKNFLDEGKVVGNDGFETKTTRCNFYGFCLLAIRPYQIPDAMKTPPQPAVNQIKNGDGK